MALCKCIALQSILASLLLGCILHNIMMDRNDQYDVTWPWVEVLS